MVEFLKIFQLLNAMKELIELKKTVAKLRSPNGCPWDKVQTHKSLTNCLIEECSEVLDTIDREDYPHMREELGDLLLQVVMHAQIAEESNHFNFEDTARDINEKLIRRHPHVFGQLEGIHTSEDVLLNWEEIKQLEKEKKGSVSSSTFKDLPPQLPALVFAKDVFKQIKNKKITLRGHIDEADIQKKSMCLTEEKLGEELFNLSSAAKLANLDPESALRRYTSNLMRELS
jgi:XTP/dITP diphosphohydrolase/tetrapyrrole methylase family protein/MazG family protein